MTITEIKNLTKFLSEEEVEKIKEEIKNKEDVLKSGNLDEEELIQVLNTLFAILVIEKTLESEIEGVEEIRAELEEELLEAYNTYDSYMGKYKKEDKKKKKRWLLDFLFLSENVRARKDNISTSNKTIAKLQTELNELRQQKSDDNLRRVVNKRDRAFHDFCDRPEKCHNPMHHHPDIRDKMVNRAEKMLYKKIEKDIKRGIEPRIKNPEIVREVIYKERLNREDVGVKMDKTELSSAQESRAEKEKVNIQGRNM